MVIFELHHPTDIYKLEIYGKEKCSLSSIYQSINQLITYLSIYPSIHLYQYRLMGYFMGYNPLLSLFWHTNLRTSDQQGHPLSWLLRPSNMAPTFFNHILIFWQSRMFQAYLYAFLAPDLKSFF